VLAGRGLTEAVTFSFLAGSAARVFGGGDAALTLTNPISSDLDVMRPSLLPNLVAAAGRNAARGWRDCALFEVGPQYAGTGPDDQSMAAAGIRSGRRGPRHWAEPTRAVDAFDAKADALALMAALGVPVDKLAIKREAPAWYHPGRSAVAWLQPGRALTAFGELNPAVLAALDVAGPVVAFEVFLDRLPAPKATRAGTRPALQLAALQPLERDFAFVVDDAVPAQDIVEAVRRVEPTLVVDVRVFDVFSGGALAAGKKSIAISVVLQPRERSLNDAEIEALGARLVEAVGRATGGALRG
jgi:phenylalanyl-tRNA synthetase beta chain